MRWTPLNLLLALLVILGLTSAACAQRSSEDPARMVGGEAIDGAPTPSTATPSQVVEQAVDDVAAFWERTYPRVYGGSFAPLEGGLWPYGPQTEVPPCESPPPAYVEIADNAFYCPGPDLIAWDDVSLVPRLFEAFGAFTLGIVFAHEFGHAVQARARVTANDTIVLEQQADCFAGAWTADVDDGNAEHFELDVGDLDSAMSGFLALRDTVGVGAADPAAHGTGFDRIGAFIDGFDNGAERCADYPDLHAAGRLLVVQVPFTSLDDLERGGNLPLTELETLLYDDLDDFWRTLFDDLGRTWTPVDAVTAVPAARDEIDCGDDTLGPDEIRDLSIYCAASNQIYIDDAHLIPALNEIGDYAVVTEIARRFADAAQAQLGANALGGDVSSLRSDCLVGVYAQSGFVGDREGQQLFLSPGDLDEAILAFLYVSDRDEPATDASIATAFERVQTFRAGFRDGLDACLDR